LTTLTRWVLAHKRLVAGSWILVTIAAFAAIQPASDALSQEFTVPGREGFEANREIASVYGNGGDVAPIVPVVTLPAGRTFDAPAKAELETALGEVQAALPDARIASYASTGDPAFLSADRRTTFALVYIPYRPGLEPGQAEAQRAQAAVDGLTVGGSPVEITGLEALRAAGAEGAGADDTSVSVLVEVLVAGLGALIVLAVVFSSLMAFVPLLMAVVAVPTTFLLVWPLAELTDVSVVIQFLVALIGLGIAIDYALLVVMRWREEHRDGVSEEVAVERAMEHAGRAVVFSGTTVAVALLALVVLPVPFLRSIGIAGMFIPLVSVAVALTLLPVVLATCGPRLDRRRLRRADASGRLWTAWARGVVRHRWVAAAASAAVLAALAGAALTIQMGSPRADALAQSGAARAGFEKLEAAGLGAGPLTPFEAIARAGDPEVVAERLAGVAGVRAAVAPAEWRRDGTALVAVVPADDGSSAEGRATLDRLRAVTPAGVAIGGAAAQSADFVDAVYGNFALLVALVTVLTFVLLARAFRSLVLALKAVALNVLSVGAAWGVMVLVWQEGLGSEAIWGIEATGAINVEMPIVVFAFLFGISMDYQVFIISRMREAYDRTGSTRSAVVEGIGRTGRLVTSAALILGLAFVALSASPGTEVKMFATALAAGIVIDATIVRAILVPAVVAILGRFNWWLPHRPARWLRVQPSLVRREPAVDEI
jgi:RND superfamily putative drug exporter